MSQAHKHYRSQPKPRTMIESLERTIISATSDKARLEDLLSRESAKKWGPAKVNRQLRRLRRAVQRIGYAEGLLMRAKARAARRAT